MNGEHAFATSGGTAWRRRQRRLRAFRRFVLWHSKMEVAAALHHTSGLRTSTTTQFSSTAVEPIAPRVVDPLPPIEEFTGPVYDQVHQVQFAAGEMPENMVEFPVVQEQVIVQAIPEVVGSLPPVEEFTRPVYNHVHQEQFAAGEMTENLVEIPVVQEQVIVQAFPVVDDSLPPVEEFTGPGFYQVHLEHIAAVPAVTEFFPLSDDEGGELSAGLRPAPLWEPLPLERVQRHTVEQMIESFVPVQVLDAPVSHQVDSVVDMLKILDKLLPDVEQVIEVPKILQHTVPHRSSLLEPQMAEQLAEVPTNPDTVLCVFTRSPAPRMEDQLVEVPPIVPQLVPFFTGADGYVWRQLSGPTGAYWWRVGSSHTQWAPPTGVHRQARAVYKYWPP